MSKNLEGCNRMPAQPVTASQTGQTTKAPATSHRLLSVWLKTAMLVLLGASSGLYAAPPTMELFTAGGSTTATGPSTSAQTNTYAFNPDNPSGTTASSTYYPKTAVTYTIENQQYTGTLANTGLVFGGDGDNIYIPLSGQGSPAATDFTSSRLNATPGTGIDINNNYGTRFLLRAGRLDNNSTHNTSTVNGGLGHYFGDIVVAWNRPVFNPIINISGLGGTSSNLGFAAQFQLSSPPTGTTISRLSGRNMGVSGFNITNTAADIGATASAGGSSGSIQVLNDNPITTLRFRVYVRSDSTTNSTDWGSTTAADAFVFSASSVDSTVGDLYVSKTNNTTSVVQGGSTTYTVRVTNAGPSTIATPILKDSSSTGLTATAVGCSSASGNKCTTTPTLASLNSGITIASLASGEFYEILVTSNVTASSGNVTNTATVELPNFASSTGESCVTSNGITRSYNQTTGTCTTTDTDSVTPATNLAITKTGTTSVKAGQPVSYTIKVWNKGPAAVTDAVMTDNVPANISGPILTCVASGTATCGTFNTHVAGSNARSATGISLPVDSTGNTSYVTYTVTGLAYQTGTFTNTATISSASVPETDSSDNSASKSTTITVDAPVTSGTASNQCSAAQAVNILTPTAFTVFDGDGTGASFTGTLAATVNNTGTVYGTGTNGAIVLSGKLSWSYGSPIVTGSTLSIRVNGVDYAVLTTPGASSNGSASSNAGTATLTALNGASVTPATLTIDNTYTSYTGRATFTLTLPTGVTSITSAQAVYQNNNPRTPTGSTGDDFGVSLDSALQCQKPIVKIAKISNGGVGTFGFTGLSNLSNASGTAVTTDSVSTTTAGTAVTSAQVNYATANSTAVGITESAVSGYNLTAASCTDANSAVTSNTGSFGSLSGNTLTIPAANVKYGANLTCTFNNTKQRNLTLRKIWVNARINDAATITATGLNSFVSTANTASETDTASAQAVTVGSTVTLGENISTGAGYYNAVLSCTRDSDNAAVSITGNNLIMPDADVTCGYTNSRKSASLTLQKIWANAKLNDAATITATGLTSLSAVANTASETDVAAGQTVYAGDSITLGETFTTGSISNYTSSLACTGNATALTGSTLTVNPADTAITCSYTNSRIAQQLSLSKQWQNAVNGHTATATTTGGTNNATFSSTSTGNNSTNGSAVTMYAGDVVTLPTETLGGGASAAQYNSTLACSGGTTLASGAVARSITISNSTTATVCTYTNARKSATLTLSKIWSAGSIAGNTATVTSSGFGNNATSGTSTATTAGNTTTGTSVTVYAGESGTISETFGTGNASNYSATLACSGNSTALSGNTLSINPADTAISCSYTNTVAGTDLAIDKTGTSSVTQGNNVSYSIKVWNKGPGAASSSTFTDTVPSALTNVSWSCSASGSAVCGTASGSGNSISVATGTLPVNASSTAPTSGSYLTFTVNGTASSSGNITNTATIAVTSGADPVSSNNSSSASTTISTPAAIIADTPQKEARFVITPDLPTIYRGQSGTQLISITNQGPDDASGTVAVFKPRTQTGVTVTSVKIVNGANCSLSSGEWSCPVGSIANGGSFQLQVGYDTTASSTLGTAIQADIRVGSNEFNPGSGVGESLYNVWGSTNPNGNSQFNEIRPNGAFALSYGTANGSENVNLSTVWLPTQVNPTGAYLTQAAIGGNNSVFGPSGTYNPMISRIITSLNTDTAKSQTLLALDPATQAGDNRRVWQLITGIYVPANSTASLCIGNAGSQLDDGAYIMLNGSQVGTDGKWSSSPFIQTSVPLNTGYNRITYRIANRNTPGSNEDYAQGLYGEIGLSINGGACTAASLDATARLQIPASINIVEKQVVNISGQVFEDNSGSTAVNSNAYNGVKNIGEAGITGSSVSITNCNSTTVATTKTDANGEYSFSLSPTDLPAGSFCIAQTNLTGYSSVSGTTGYSRATDRITVSNTGASSYSNHNFGDARLTALLSEDGQQTITAGGVADYPHRLTAQSVLTINSLNQTPSQQPANSTDQNWQAVVYRDSNCNGKVDSGESLFSQSLPLSLKNAEEACLVQRVYAPATASMGAQHLGQLQASFSVTLADNSQITGSTLQRQDTTLLGSAGLTMQKGVRSVASCPSTAADTGSFGVQNQVQNGGYLEYEITYRNNTTKNLIDVSIKDSVPTGTVYKTASCTSTPSGSCNASHTNGALLWQTGGTLLPNQQGKVRFCVQVP
ncbi:prealbumin-like fold domain-containing protein [Alkanindiges illinoisensis]|uniref:prealbumin-like fold domain-containing protein n=1 Tax=Alkanindiges illinoisensis TaxID=197183 RepID=UPI00146FC4F6|nr:SdrD B-like domain-containing protein [Alkanindiges illinoisensis]